VENQVKKSAKISILIVID